MNVMDQRFLPMPNNSPPNRQDEVETVLNARPHEIGLNPLLLPIVKKHCVSTASSISFDAEYEHRGDSLFKYSQELEKGILHFPLSNARASVENRLWTS